MKNLFVRFLPILLAALAVLSLPLPSDAAAAYAVPSHAVSAPGAAPLIPVPAAPAFVSGAPAPAKKADAAGLRHADTARGIKMDLVREGTLVRTGARLRYRHANGKYVKSAWITVKGKTYYFDKKTFAVTGLRKIGHYYYIFSPKGVLCKGWIRHKNKMYYGSVNHRGRLLTGWQKIGGKRYYMSVKTLNRLTGFQYIGGKIYYFNARGVQQTTNQYVNGRRVTFNANGSVASIGKKAAPSRSTYKGQQVVDYAVQFVGNPYKWGGSSLTHGADCSGFVMAVYAHFGIQLPHYDAWIRQKGRAVDSLANALPGDVVCYDGHVAIYMGGGRIVHAADYQYGICIWNNAAYRRILSIRRFF